MRTESEFSKVKVAIVDKGDQDAQKSLLHHMCYGHPGRKPPSNTNFPAMNAPISSPSQAAACSIASASSLRTSPNQLASVPAPPPQDNKPPSTDAFLKDFTLVAEAAKRAQVAVMVREFENCGL
ncbi:hypothetical protein A9K55_006939 [Cordyceps militaris]|uniref:Uncharacterized protein n=1 Tax=Cordyceps militaris TaxID=73501 RepID=A0A2H4SBW2_CORMI|nr:hypothetical protein A9K55_006939 [Cordyceps militaris]